MLLLVVQTEHNQVADGLILDAIAGQQLPHAIVDPLAVLADLGHGRPGDQAPLGSRVPLADGLVVGVEEIPVCRVRFVAFEVRGEQKGLKKPCDVSPVPFGGAHIGHRLHDLILGREGLGQPLRGRSYVLVTGGQVELLCWAAGGKGAGAGGRA